MVLRILFILFPVLFGVICGLQSNDNRWRKFTASGVADSSAVFASGTTSSIFQNYPIKTLPSNSIACSFSGYIPNSPFQCLNLKGWKKKIVLSFMEFKNCPSRKSSLISSSRRISLDSDKYKGDDSFNIYGQTLNDIIQLDNIGSDNNSQLSDVSDASLKPTVASSDFDTNGSSFNYENDSVKRGVNVPIVGCDCKIRNDLLDLGQMHYPRYLLNAVCQSDQQDTNEYPPKCRRGANCKPLEYKVRVLTLRGDFDQSQKDPTLVLLPDVLRSFWKFKTVTVAAGCFCSY